MVAWPLTCSPPIYDAVNNLLAYFAQESGSYMFYEKEIVFKGGFAFAVALVSFIAVATIALFKGRAYCNTICPVGTFLSFTARFSLFRLGGDEFAVILTNGDYQIRDELIQKLKTSMKELESKEQPWEQVSIRGPFLR